MRRLRRKAEHETVSVALLVLALAAAGALRGQPQVSAAASSGIAVTTTTDSVAGDGQCSLREALQAADTDSPDDACPAGHGADIITVPAGYYLLTRVRPSGGESIERLAVNSDVQIVGSDEATTVIDGNHADHVLEIDGAHQVTIEHLTLQHGGGADGPSPTCVGGGMQVDGGTVTLRHVIVTQNVATCLAGGGIINYGTLALDHSQVRANSVFFAGGGGIWNHGTLTLTDSSVSQNGADDDGGGIWSDGTLVLQGSSVTQNGMGPIEHDLPPWGVGIYTAGDATITNSTIADNQGRTTDHGGAVFGGGIANAGTLRLVNSTITANRITSEGIDEAFGFGAGLYNRGSATLRDTILAGNTFYYDDISDDLDPTTTPQDCDGTLISQGYNLIGATTACTIMGDGAGNRLNVNPELGPLQDNGGPTLTHALLAQSPALDAGNPTAEQCATTDQRGVARPQDGNGDGLARCDIGAVEESPTIRASPSPAPNRLGWTHATTTVTLSTTTLPGTSDIASITYSVSGAQGASSPTTVTGDTASIVVSAEGITTISYVATDTSGAVSAPQTATVKLDTTAPAATAPVQSLAVQQTGTTTLPVTLKWPASDTGSGGVTYHVQSSQNGGAFSDVALSWAGAQGITLYLAPGSTYQYRVQATDAAGNVSPWLTGPRFTLTAIQESSPTIAYSGAWTTSKLSGAYGGSVSSASAAGATATFTFTGTSVAWISTLSRDRGKADVYFDGVRVGTVDLYAPTTTLHAVVFAKSGLSNTTHTLQVRVLGTKNSASSGVRVDVDGFVVIR
jgi:CSLREA domain-containing protein